MSLLSDLPVLLVPGLFLLALLSLAGRYVYRWVKAGYESGTASE